MKEKRKVRVLQLVIGGDLEHAKCYSNIRDMVRDNSGLKGMYGAIQQGLYKPNGDILAAKKYSINGSDIRRYEIRDV